VYYFYIYSFTSLSLNIEDKTQNTYRGLLDVFAVSVHSFLTGSKSNLSIVLQVGTPSMLVVLHWKGGWRPPSVVGPATAVNEREGKESLEAILASRLPYLANKAIMS
jgi:hypothetical protein